MSEVREHTGAPLQAVAHEVDRDEEPGDDSSGWGFAAFLVVVSLLVGAALVF